LVTLLTPPANPVRPPITFDAKDETLLTTDAAKAEPGMVGSDIVDGIFGADVEVEGMDAVGLTVEVTGRGTEGS